jgi:hypothetical protein
MKDLKEYIKEGLFDDIDKIEGKNSLASNVKQLKKEIVDWISNNYYISYARKSQHKLKKRTIKVDMTTVPPTVNYNYDLYASNNLTSLNNNGMFQWGKVEGNFGCSFCDSLTSLKGSPKEVGGEFNCNGSRSLKSLEGSPEKVKYFNCSQCAGLKSLEGASKEVSEIFVCAHCNSLKNLVGAPEKVGCDFYCQGCKSLASLKGAPKEVDRDFYCFNCGTKFTEEDVKKVSKVKERIICKQ